VFKFIASKRDLRWGFNCICYMLCGIMIINPFSSAFIYFYLFKIYGTYNSELAQPLQEYKWGELCFHYCQYQR
jgi:hypothetical protein